MTKSEFIKNIKNGTAYFKIMDKETNLTHYCKIVESDGDSIDYKVRCIAIDIDGNRINSFDTFWCAKWYLDDLFDFKNYFGYNVKFLTNIKEGVNNECTN